MLSTDLRSMWVYAAMLCALILAGCTDNTLAGPPPIVIPEESEPVNFSRHIVPIFQTSCGTAGCHLDGENAADVALGSWEALMAGSSEYGAQVIPYASRRSMLFQHINTDTTIGPAALPRMPLGRDPLPREQILTIKRWIDEGGRSDAGVVYLGNPNRARVFVTNQSEDAVTVIDREAELVVRYFGTGQKSGGDPEAPHNITLSPDGAYIYVNMIAGGTVEKFDALTFTKLGSVHVGISPAQVAVSADGTRLFVSNFDIQLRERFIVVVDAASMRVTDTIQDVGNAPHGVVISPDGTTLITTNALGDDLSIIDIASLEVVRRVPAMPNSPLPPGNPPRVEPYQGAFTPDGAFFWFSCRKSAQIRILDVAAGRVVDSIDVGPRPLIPNFTRDGSEFWVPCQGSDEIQIINTATRSVVATVPDMLAQPHAVAFSHDGQNAWITCENQNGEQHHPTSGDGGIIQGRVYVVNVRSRSIRRSIEVGGFAAGIAVGD